MTVRLLAAFAVVLAILGPVDQIRDDLQQPAFRASADLVGVDVSVRRGGRPVVNLVAADFEVVDNGVRQVVSDLSFGKLPIDVTVALDVSQSVTGAVLDRLRRAVRQLVSDLGPSDRLKLMTFNMRVKRVMDFVESASPATTEAAFKAMSGAGSTAVFDSIAVVLAEPATPERRHLLVVFSDGEDSASITDMPTLLELARRTTPTLGVVLGGTGGPVYLSGTGPQTFTTRSANVAQRANAENYAALARETGGLVMFADLGGDIGATFRRLLGDFRQSYVLYFSPTGVERQGWHALSVRVVRSGAYEVRARSGMRGGDTKEPTMNRREFLAGAGTLPIVTAGVRLHGQAQAPAPAGDRASWVAMLRKVADPVLSNLSAGTLAARMPVEQAAGTNRRTVTYLEAAGRLIAGLAPWIELADDGTPEGRTRAEYAALTRRAIARAVDPASLDFMNFTRERQPLVDAAFLAHGLLRARRALVAELDATTRRQLIAALESTRAIAPPFNNWLLFSATVEAGLAVLGASWDRMRVDYALRQHDQWYKGDGIYGDGPAFHWDYYNSFVIQPMLIDVLDVVRDENAAWKALETRARERAMRYAGILERLIGPDGTFPPTGRSIAYRCGAFQALAQSALRHALPADVTPPQVRGALGAVIRRSLGAAGTFDDGGWLRIGFCGHQPGVGETYISTGSLYLCSVAFLPLGLPASDDFWSAPERPWTSVLAWGGQAFPIDRALAT